MGIVYPRPAMRSAEERKIRNRLAEMQFEREYHVYDANGASHGNFPTLDEARGCVAFDGLDEWSIYYGSSNLIEQS